MIIKCLQCSALKEIRAYLLKQGRGKYCSRSCADLARIGTTAWNKGLTIKDSRVAKYVEGGKKTQFKKGEHKNEQNINWKGESVGYTALHDWIRARLGKPTMCSNKECFYPRKDADGRMMISPRSFQWANISHEYKRDLSDWMQLCASCHTSYDLQFSKQPHRYSSYLQAA